MYAARATLSVDTVRERLPMRRWAREVVVMRGGNLRAGAYTMRETGDSGRALARRASRRRGSVRSVGG